MPSTKPKTSKKTTPAAALAATATGTNATRCRITDVARLLKCRYARARDLMLQGVLGEATPDPLSVERSAVDAYLAARAGASA